MIFDEPSKKRGLLTQGHPFAHFVSSCAQTAESDLALAPGGQILGRQPLPPGQLRALLDAGSSGGRGRSLVLSDGSWIPAVAPEVVKCHPAGQEHRKRGSSLPPTPALFLGLDLSSLYTQVIAQALALEWLPQTLLAPNIQCELGELWVSVIPPMPLPVLSVSGVQT